MTSVARFEPLKMFLQTYFICPLLWLEKGSRLRILLTILVSYFQDGEQKTLPVNAFSTISIEQVSEMTNNFIALGKNFIYGSSTNPCDYLFFISNGWFC